MKPRNRIKRAVRHGAARALALGPLTFLLVAGAGCPTLFESATHRAAVIRQADVGRDGARTVSDPDAVVNAYAILSADADAGATTITVSNIADLGTNFSRALAQGDLLLIIQMQGATINTTDTLDYGSVASEADLGGAGRYELVGVEAVAATSNRITLACPLRHSYISADRTQVIRVPQYTTLTIGPAASITAPEWNGATGGVVAVHAESTVRLEGSIDASARGFRGGAADNSSASASTGVTIYRSETSSQGAEKGESIAGYQDDYANGRYGRGAPANGGGGGNSHNAGGGGGANAGDPAGWRRGQGVMLGSVVGAAAWALDPGYINNPVTANTRTSSEGGGRGGYSYAGADQNALTVGPGVESWGGNNRREVGGLGGHPLASSPTTRLFLGGGGGAGDRNNGSEGSAGGNGGGLIFLIAGSITGSGSIVANGGDAPTSPGVAAGGDAPGGGGGGGTVVINASSLGEITVSVDGGAGGNQTGSGGDNEAEGPGGGGGGGYIAIAGTGSPVLSATGGLGGTTNRASMSEFPSDGATAGHDGVTNGNASSFFYCGASPATTIETKPSNPSADTTGDFTFTNTSSPVTYQCKLDAADWAACPAAYTTSVLGEGSHTLSVRATDAFGNEEVTPPSYTWVVDTTAPDTRIDTKPTDPSRSLIGAFTFGSNESPVSYACSLDDAAWAACPASFATEALADGTHTLSVRATDAAGNVDATPASYTWTVSTTLRTTIVTHPSSPTDDTTGDFTFTNTQPEVSYQCKLDGSEWVACSASYTTPVLADGSHTLSVRATLAVGDAGVLVEDPPVTFTWMVDTIKPVTTIVTHPTDPTNDPTGDFTFTNARSPVTYECKLDSGAWTPCGPSYTTPALTDGTHTLSVRAVANATDGGALVEEPPVVYTWVVDTTPPDTTIASKPSSPTSDSVGTFTFASNESPVTYACALDAADWAPCPATYATPALASGAHTLSVRATDAAGNVDATPATYAWTVQGGGAADGGVVIDAQSGEANPIIDGGVRDGVRADVAADRQQAVPEPGSDDAAAPIVEPERDAGPSPADVGPDVSSPPTPDASAATTDSAAVASEDAAPPAESDAAPAAEAPKLLGGGFCAVSPSRSVSPVGFLLLALAGLALLRRRR